jgi:hypothetical protein
VSLVAPLDVIVIWDDFIRPPGPKMVVCVEPASGFFFRINSEGKWQTPVMIRRREHPFLKRDSAIECGDPFELDDYVIEESIRRHGVIGKISTTHASEIYAAAFGSVVLSSEQKELVRAALGCAPLPGP